MTISNAELQRALGRVEGNQDGFKERMDGFERKLDAGFAEMRTALAHSEEMKAAAFDKISTRLDAIEKIETERRGAWRVLIVIAGAVSALVASAVKYFWG